MTQMQPINDIANKATKGMFWSLAEYFGLYAMQFVISVILARLLLPEQFGLIGMLTLFMVVAQILTIGGYGSAFIQKKDASHLDACSIFYFNLIIGAALTLLLFISAPLIAGFFREPILIQIIRVLSFNILINAGALIPTSLLSKQMNFKPLFIVNLSAILISGIVSVILAVQGFGVWSIVVQSMLNSLLRTVLIWKASRWQPSLLFSGTALKNLFPFGSRMLISGLLDAFFQNLYQPVIGRLFSAADLGYYVRAQTFQTAISQPIGSALWRVIFPALSEVQDDPIKMKQIVRQVFVMIIFFYFPLMIGLIVVAKPLITLMLTARWSASINYFQLFCLTGLFYPLEVINQSVILAHGKSNLLLKLEVIKKSLIVLGIAVTFRWGINALLYGQIATSVLTFCLSSYYSKHFIQYSTFDQLRDVIPSLFMSLIMGIGIYLIGTTINSQLLQISMQSFIGVLFYLAINYIFDRPIVVKVVLFAKQLVRLQVAS